MFHFPFKRCFSGKGEGDEQEDKCVFLEQRFEEELEIIVLYTHLSEIKCVLGANSIE